MYTERSRDRLHRGLGVESRRSPAERNATKNAQAIAAVRMIAHTRTHARKIYFLAKSQFEAAVNFKLYMSINNTQWFKN